MIPYGKQEITQADVEAVIEVLHSDFLTQGPAVPQFESEVAKICNVQYAVATNSATSSLHIACLSLGLGAGDYFWTSPITFVASANCGLYCGARVDFVDINPLTYNICHVALESKLIEAKIAGRLPKILIVVHMCGQSANMKELHNLSVRFGFKIIEDASHAIGGFYNGQPIGSCAYSDITIFSFHPVKIITTGEGGIAVTNSKTMATEMELLRSHGITRNTNQMTHSPDGLWYYQQIKLGFNYRMTDIQAALGLSQIKRIKDYVARRHHIAESYNHLLSNLPIVTPWQDKDSFSAFHLYIIRLKLDLIGKSRQEIFDCLRESGVGVNVHYIPVHLQPYFLNLGFKIGDFPVAEKYYSEVISLPIFPGLIASEQERVIKALKEALL